MSNRTAIIMTVAAALAVALGLVLLAFKQDQSKKSQAASGDARVGENVVATYVGGEVTAQQLRDYINKLVEREGTHAVCEKHGYDHSKCDKAEKCESHPLNSVESYRLLLKQLVLEKMLDRWIREKGMTARGDVSHRLQHLAEELDLTSLAGKLHADKLKPDRVEIQQYYDQNKDKYGDRPFAEVESEIERTLTARKEAEYVPRYVEELKKNAAIERNYELLRVPEPTDADIRGYYADHAKEFVRPETVRVQYVTFSTGDREKAEQTLAKLRAGEPFDATATTETLDQGKAAGHSAQFLETVFRYRQGEMTPVFEEGGTLYIARILERASAGQRPFEAVREEVKAAVYLAKERARLEQNKYDALFAIHGKRFTVEKFLTEFDELSAAQRQRFANFSAKTNLLEQLIVKELLVEQGGDEAKDRQEQEVREDVKRQALQQMLHKEEVDEKISVPDPEARQFYDKYRERLMEPAKAKVSVIRVSQGVSDDERKRARTRIEEAQKKLSAGAEFAAVAKEYSEDWTASSGGAIEQWIYEGASQMAEYAEHDFHQRVFALDAGKTSDIFEFRDILWIVKVRERAAERKLSFEEAKPQIVELLQAQKHDERSREMQNELFEKSQLTVRESALSRLLATESRQHTGEPRTEHGMTGHEMEGLMP